MYHVLNGEPKAKAAREHLLKFDFEACAMLWRRGALAAACRNGLPVGHRSCDGARATSSVSTVATLAPRSQESRRQVKSLHQVLQ